MTPQEQAHFQVLRTLEQHPDCSQRELARHIGLSLGRTNYVLKALVQKGWVKIDRFMQSPEKTNKTAYLLTPAGLQHRLMLTSKYITTKKQEFLALQMELATLVAERADPKFKNVPLTGGPAE